MVPFVNLLLSGVWHHAVNIGSVSIAGKTIDDWRNAAIAPQMLPNSTFLASLQGTSLHDKAPGLTILTGSGRSPSILDGPRVQQWVRNNIGNIEPGGTSDGVVGVNSSQAGGPTANVFTNSNVQYLPLYPYWHTQLECGPTGLGDGKLQTDVGSFVNMINACSLADQTAHNNACLGQYSNQTAFCSTLPTLIQQGDCVNAAIKTYQTCISYCTPP